MRNYIPLFILIILFISVWSCNDFGTTNQKQGDASVNDSATCENETIKDPNNAKPMALMMRQLVSTAESIRQKIIKGEQPDSIHFPFVRFYLVEPTDPNVLEPQFYENARLFQDAYYAVFEKGADKETYNAMIDACIGCHQSYCSGPIKRIKKLYIN